MSSPATRSEGPALAPELRSLVPEQPRSHSPADPGARDGEGGAVV